MTVLTEAIKDAVTAFETRANLKGIPHEVRDLPDGPYLIFYLAQPTNRFFELLLDAVESLPNDSPFKERATIKKRRGIPPERLHMPEARLLRTILSESLTVDKYSFERGGMADRYIPSVFGAEDEIVAKSNHMVYGRRGSGKSSLLVFAMHRLKQSGGAFAWVAMQVYEGREDIQVIIDILIEVLTQVRNYATDTIEFDRLLEELVILSRADSNLTARLDRLIPRIRRAIEPVALTYGSVTLFLDDLHVLSPRLQPKLLAKLYSIARGNNVFIKLSGIEQFSMTWDPETRQGLEPPHDVQILRLDYNLTMPKKSLDHIISILDAHAQYSGLPNIGFLSGRNVLSRLVWVAAGVPRDALNLFSQAMARAAVKDQKLVSITSVNAAASEMAEDKMRHLQADASRDMDRVNELLTRVRFFCIEKNRSNAFLVEIRNDHQDYSLIEKLIALRLLHVLHEGITPDKAGRRYKALMLDYGFYVGIRAAKSVELFKREPEPLQAKELRNLPNFPLK